VGSPYTRIEGNQALAARPIKRDDGRAATRALEGCTR
jgi:hypothetical protein